MGREGVELWGIAYPEKTTGRGKGKKRSFDMTDQEFEKGLAELMAEDGPAKKAGKTGGFGNPGAGRKR